MAQLKDTVVSGSLRVTDTTYTTNLNVSSSTLWGVTYTNTGGVYASTTAGTAGYLLQSNATSAPSWIQATNTSVANTIVKRDANKNFSAGTITAALDGNATTATTASYLSAPNESGYHTNDKGNPIHNRSTATDYFCIVSNDIRSTIRMYYETGALETTGSITAGARETTTAPSSLTSVNRLIITPYYHTGGPWYIKSMDNSSDAFLALYYSNSELLRIKHDGTFQSALIVKSTGSNRANIRMVTVADQPNDFHLGSNNTDQWSITSRASNESYSLNVYSGASGIGYCTRWEYSTGKFLMLHGAEVTGNLTASGTINNYNFSTQSSLNANDIRTTNGCWIVNAAITNAPNTDHGLLLGVASVGTPNQMFFSDNQLYVYKRGYISGAWTDWQKMKAGYADSAGSCTGHAASDLALSGGVMTGALQFNSRGINGIYNGPNDAANGVGGALNNLVISAWYGVSFTTSCTTQTYTNTNAVSINCRNGNVYAARFNGPLTGNVTGNCSGSSGSCTGNAATASEAQIVQSRNTNFDVKQSNNGGTARYPTGFYITDKNSLLVGYCQNSINTNGSISISLGARNWQTDGTTKHTNYIELTVTKNGTQSYYVSAPAAFRNAIGIGSNSDTFEMSRADHNKDLGIIINNTGNNGEGSDTVPPKTPLKLGFLIGTTGLGGIYDYTSSYWRVACWANGYTVFGGSMAIVRSLNANKTLCLSTDKEVEVQNKAMNGWVPIKAYAFTNMSSCLVKTNIKPLTYEDGLKVLALNPVSFDFKKNFGPENQFGLIAEEVEELIPYAVSTPKDYDPNNFDESKGINQPIKSLDYSKLVPFMIKMIQIQQEEINDLKQKISAN